MDMRVFWAVLAAVGVVAVLWLVGAEVQQRRQEAAVSEAWAGVVRAANTPDPMGLQAQAVQDRARSQQAQREAVAMSLNRRLLTGNQRCVGGVVVVADGTSYTQLGTVGDPVRCDGRYADRPIR